MEHMGFFYELREQGVPVSVKYILDYHEALQRGLGEGGLDQIYTLLRLICIKRLEHIDPFERTFARYFLGLELPPPGEPVDLDTLLESKPFKEWLTEYLEEEGMELKDFYYHERAEELLKRFLETVAAQTGAHHGGGRWIGTGGYSPFGHSGRAVRGFRVGGSSRGRSAIKVLGERRYSDYSPKAELKAENIRQVLGSLKHLVPAGPKTEIDLDETIRKTAKNAGEIELEFTSEIRDKIKVILMIDNGGYSMDRYVPLVRLVFNKMHDRFKELKTYFFHNCIYANIYTDARRISPISTEKLFQESKNTRLFIIGDAAMAPEELVMPGGAISWESHHTETGLSWLQRLRTHFPYSVWLNPIPAERWDYTWGNYTIRKVSEVFHMEDLTLDGLKNTVEYLEIQRTI
jgi:uncharacterized protein with von Willebrand factor type A (vWA) domain